MQFKKDNLATHRIHYPCSYSDLCTPVGEMVRMTKLHSSSWEEKAAGMKKVREDYQNMQRRLNIATKRIEMMSAEVSVNLFCETPLMLCSSVTSLLSWNRVSFYNCSYVCMNVYMSRKNKSSTWKDWITGSTSSVRWWEQEAMAEGGSTGSSHSRRSLDNKGNQIHWIHSCLAIGHSFLCLSRSV